LLLLPPLQLTPLQRLNSPPKERASFEVIEELTTIEVVETAEQRQLKMK